MEDKGTEMTAPSRIGDLATSDVVVRLRTQDGRDERLYCHSPLLVDNCKYFADRLSENWPTCQILESRKCVEVYCDESDVDYHVTILRLFYVGPNHSAAEMFHGVRNAIGILRVAFDLGCPEVVAASVNYLEAVPWEETEEEEILKIIPRMGSQAEPVLARLQPVNHSAVVKIFLSALHFATSSPPPVMNDLKASAQEQLEYMLTEDDDAPLLTADDKIKLEVKECSERLLNQFKNQVESLLHLPIESAPHGGKLQLLHSCLIDLLWDCQILSKLEIMKEFVVSWVETSEDIIKVVARHASGNVETLKTKLKIIEVAAEALDTIGQGTVILPTVKRLHMVKVWLPFVRLVKPLVDSAMAKDDEDSLPFEVESELWQLLESTFVSIILTLPSRDQAEILTEWFSSENIQYPDLTEAFQVWCYRSKTAKRRLTLME